MSFQQGLSGLNASAKHLDTIGNNVANANTIGFKQSQAQFADLYATSLAGSGAVQVGTGVKIASVAQQFTQGNITNTSNSMDTAISGKGFFRMVDQSGAISYTRNGQFQLDKNGYIVNGQGQQLSGYAAVNGVITAAQPTPIQIVASDLTPKQTSKVSIGLNLDQRMALPTISPFDPNNPQTYNSSTSLTVYDSQGASHVASMYFAKTAANSWDAFLTVDGNQVPAAGTRLTAMTFNTSGALTAPTAAVASAGFDPVPAPISVVGASVTTGSAVVTGPSTVGLLAGATVTGTGIPAGTTIASIDSANQFTMSAAATATNASATLTVTNPASAANQVINFDFTGTSQFGGSFGVNTMTQDGFTSGRLSGFTTSPDGIILGRYTNGQSRALAQVVLANFTNPQGLQPLGNNGWAETSASGGPLVGTPGSSSLGVLQSSAVEDSNVDLTAELVNMITAQRVYQANAQTIKTQDQVLQTLVNLR